MSKDLIVGRINPLSVFNRNRFPFWRDDDFGNVFDGLWDTFDNAFGTRSYSDENNNIVIEIEAPGFNKDNIGVEITNGVLTVKGERELGNEKSVGKSSVFKQYQVGSLTDAECKIKDGIIYVTVKTPEEEKPKKIEVNTE